MNPEYERLNKYIDDLQAGQHPAVGQPRDDEEAELFQQAAAWAGAQPGADEPDPDFVRDLRARMLLAGQQHGAATAPNAATPVAAAATSHTPVLMPVPVQRRGWRLSRRQLLGTAATAAAGLLAGFGLDHLPFGDQKMVEAFAEPEGKINPQQGRWFAVARAADMKLGEAVSFNAGYVKGFVLAQDAGFVALSGVCTHLGCELKWYGQNAVFGCTCHGSSFDTSGKPLTGPAIYKEPIRSLPNFQLKVEGGVIYVWA